MLNNVRLGGIFRGMGFVVVMLVIGLAGSGCNIIGWLAQASPPPDIKPAYTGLKGETVAIWVYADEAEKMDFPHIEDDLAGAIQSHLQESESTDLARTRYQSIQIMSDWRRVHGELRGKPPTEFAPDLGVTRVVYVELRNFSTHSNMSMDLFLGKGVADLRVIEVAPYKSGSAKVGFKEESVSAKYPEQEGEGENIGVPETPEINAQSVYVGTVQALGLEIAERFYQHASPDNLDTQ